MAADQTTQLFRSVGPLKLLLREFLGKFEAVPA